jgi:butyryl-CoA dehydrogenase
MFHMMNEARLMAGAAATALGYTAHLKSLEYARTRTQGRPITSKDPATPPVPIIEHPDVKRMLLAQKSYVEGALALVLYCSRLVDIASSAESREEAESATLLLDLLTPVAKSWPSQWCLEANDLAIQLHGGYGYSREYDVEQHYRDNRINAIHEGTHGIQSLDLLGRKVRQRDGAGLRLLAGEIGRTIAEADLLGGEPEQLARQLDSAWRRLSDTTATLLSCDELDVTLANSAIYLEAFGHIVIAWIWLEQVIAAADKDGSFYDGKRYAARYFYRYELPKTASQLDLLQSLDRTTLEAVLWACVPAAAADARVCLAELKLCNRGQRSRQNSSGQTVPGLIVLGFELRDELCDRQCFFYRADALAGPPDVFPRFGFHVAAAAKVHCRGI